MQVLRCQHRVRIAADMPHEGREVQDVRWMPWLQLGCPGEDDQGVHMLWGNEVEQGADRPDMPRILGERIVPVVGGPPPLLAPLRVGVRRYEQWTARIMFRLDHKDARWPYSLFHMTLHFPGG